MKARHGWWSPQTGIDFLGFNLTWRQSLKHRQYLHVNSVRKAAKRYARPWEES